MSSVVWGGGVSPAVWGMRYLLLYGWWDVSCCMGYGVSPAVSVVGCLLFCGVVGSGVWGMVSSDVWGYGVSPAVLGMGCLLLYG